MSEQAFHALVAGRVQGVSYRASARAEALRLGLCGWVRNLQDGRVEVWFGGEAEACARFLAWLRQGPPGASVSELLHEPVSYVAHAGFEVRASR
ncbi:MAG: acylphosphatase [Gammaproteobacteria bacterium]|nr:acylphosphatase [Gammaproteobacteria bacterium]